MTARRCSCQFNQCYRNQIAVHTGVSASVQAQLHLADHEVPPPVRPARVSSAVPASATDQAGATSAEDAVKVKPHKKRHKAAAPNPLAVQKPKKGSVQLAPAGAQRELNYKHCA